MLSSTIIIMILSLMGSVTAKEYHNCGCKVRGVYRTDLTGDTCANWALSGEPNTHFDGYSCVDKGYKRGIDGNPWEVHCKNQWEIGYAGNKDDAVGWCWHES